MRIRSHCGLSAHAQLPSCPKFLAMGYNNNVELVRGMLGVFIMLCRIGANVTCLNNKMLYSKKRRRKKVKNKIK